MKGVISILVVGSFVVTSAVGASPLDQESPLHPGLSAVARDIIVGVSAEESCRLPESVTAEVEGLLLGHYNAVTVQAEAAALIRVYSKCADAPRAAAFLSDRLASAEEPLVRVFLLWGLEVTRHPVAIDAIVGRLDDNAVYVTLTSSHGVRVGSERVSDAATNALDRLFPDVQAKSADAWRSWWGRERATYAARRDGNGPSN